MKISHAFALGFLACFAFACGEGEPADPQREPASLASSRAPEGSDPSTRAPGSAPNGTAQASPGQPMSPSPSPSPSPSRSPSPLTEQATVGEELFQDHCSGCHGGAVNVSSFATAADVFDYVSVNMPRNAPGSLTQSEYYGIVAFDLAENGVDLKGQTLDAASAPSVRVR